WRRLSQAKTGRGSRRFPRNAPKKTPATFGRGMAVGDDSLDTKAACRHQRLDKFLGNLSGVPAKRLVVSGMVCVSANSCNNQGPVIVGGMPSGKVFEGNKNGIQQSGGILATCLQHPIQPSSAEHFTRWIARIRDSIRVNHNLIAFD